MKKILFVSSRVEREITGIDLAKLSLDPKAGDGTVLVISAIVETPP